MDTITAAEHEALEWAFASDPPIPASERPRPFVVMVPEFRRLEDRAALGDSCTVRRAHFAPVVYQMDAGERFVRYRCMNPVSDPESWRYPPPGWTEERDRLKAHLRPERFRSLQEAIARAQRRNG